MWAELGRRWRRRKKSWAAVARRSSEGGGTDAGEAKAADRADAGEAQQHPADAVAAGAAAARTLDPGGAAVPSPAQILCAVRIAPFFPAAVGASYA